MSLYEEPTRPRATSTAAVVRELKSQGEDFEWYPTTEAMLEVIKADIQEVFGNQYRPEEYPVVDVLDCGAGDGRALTALAGRGRKLSIEKSQTLVRLQPDDVIPVGTEFYATTLLDKGAHVVFSNPPYGEYEAWASSIIRQANASIIYLIVPERWKTNRAIARALELRQATTATLYAGDFMDADRQARARIEIVKVDLRDGAAGRGHYHNGDACSVDPFRLWFDATFPRAAAPEEGEEAAPHLADETMRAAMRQEMVRGRSLIEALCHLYEQELAGLHKNYLAASELDPELMKELGIKHGALLESLKERIKGIKHRYWQELFRSYESITANLTQGSREGLLRVLNENTAVDFSEENALAITIWVLKNANSYFDSQLVEVVEKMISRANVHLYKSNARLYRDDDWRYSRWSDRGRVLERYRLDYRLVLEGMGGISTSEWDWERTRNAGLDGYAVAFLGDILAVAATLGWRVPSGASGVTAGRYWVSNQLQQFHTSDGRLLMDVRAFKKGTLHIRFHQDFIKKLNVEFGRLKGWLNNKEEAAEELDITPEEAAAYFGSKLTLLPERASQLLLGMDAGAETTH